MFLSLLISGIIGSYLYGINIKWPIYMTGLFSILTILVILPHWLKTLIVI